MKLETLSTDFFHIFYSISINSVRKIDRLQISNSLYLFKIHLYKFLHTVILSNYFQINIQKLSKEGIFGSILSQTLFHINRPFFRFVRKGNVFRILSRLKLARDTLLSLSFSFCLNLEVHAEQCNPISRFSNE